VIIFDFESHHVQKKIAASHFKNAEKPPHLLNDDMDFMLSQVAENI
jgi:hypothetical protein